MLKFKDYKNNRKSQFIIVGSLLILLGIIMIGGRDFYYYLQDNCENTKFEEFYETQKQTDNETTNEETLSEEKQEIFMEEINSYIATIKIPKIGLEKGLYEKNSYYNNVNMNIQILKESSYPDIVNGNFILAGHSGNSRVSFFKNIDKLQQDDKVSVFYKGKEYNYTVVNIYDVEKNNKLNIIRNREKTTLTLITCRNNTNKQIVVVCELN